MSELDAYEEALSRHGHGEILDSTFLAAWHALSSAYLRGLEAGVPVDSGWRERFRVGAALTLELAENHPREARFLLAEALVMGRLGRNCQRDLREQLAARLDTAREELDDPDSVPSVTAKWILGIFFDRIYRRVVTGSEPDLPSQLPELLFLGISAYFGTDVGSAELF